MLFCTLPFLGFFAVVFTLYWCLPWQRPRVWLLLAASVYFYANWSGPLACIVLASATVDYLLALGMEATASRLARRLLLACSVGGNLGLLCYFKYVNFFLRSLEQALAAAGATTSLPLLSVIVPIGISFYAFEAISYAVDVYTRRIRAERNLANFLLFILFFPHLVAGPIVRAGDFLPQVQRPKLWSWLRAHLGARLFLLGLFKKLVLADRMGLFVDPVFADPAAYGQATLWLAAIAYAIQVYCDFSGYSDMALGAAHLLGYKLTVNFALPYLSLNMSDFWRRWHISLSSWLRDYVFFPLGGSRHGRLTTYRNLLVLMTLVGLWHGANWNFVLWGLLHGVFLVVHGAFRDLCRLWPALEAALATAAGVVLRWATTMAAFVLSLAVFRAPSLADAGRMLTGMFGFGAGAFRLDPLFFWVALACLGIGHAAAVWSARDRPMRLPAPLRALGYLGLLLATLLLTPFNTRIFIYFQF